MSVILDINGVEIKPGMRVVRLIKSRNNAKDVEGIIVENKYKDHGLAIKVEFARYFDGQIMPDSGGYMHGLKSNNNYLVLD
jgi:hypothetical protein